MHINKTLAFSFIIIIMFFSCGNPKVKTDNNDNKDTVIINVNVPQFNEDSAYYFVEKQVSFGPRVNNSKQHAECAAYLESKFKEYTDNVIIQKARVRAYDGTALNISNIIASFNPEMEKRIFLSSHWDSRHIADNDPNPEFSKKPIDGANDGASGVGVLMEIARILSKNKCKIGVDLILFDAEDYGQPQKSDLPEKPDTWALGSQHWAKNPHKPNYTAKYGILLDMVGAKNATFLKEGYSREYAPDIVDKVWNITEKLGYSAYFINKETSSITDDHYYVNTITNIPTIDIIHYDNSTSSGFPAHWHTHNDTMENISRETLKAVGQTLLTVIFEEN